MQAKKAAEEKAAADKAAAEKKASNRSVGPHDMSSLSHKRACNGIQNRYKAC